MRGGPRISHGRGRASSHARAANSARLANVPCRDGDALARRRARVPAFLDCTVPIAGFATWRSRGNGYEHR